MRQIMFETEQHRLEWREEAVQFILSYSPHMSRELVEQLPDSKLLELSVDSVVRNNLDK